MIVTDFTSKYTVDNDEKILLRKINDLINKSRREYAAVYSHFLDPVQQSLISGISEFYGYISFDGGYVDAERRICRASADEYCQDSVMQNCLTGMYLVLLWDWESNVK